MSYSIEKHFSYDSVEVRWPFLIFDGLSLDSVTLVTVLVSVLLAFHFV